MAKESASNAGDVGSIPGSGRSPGGEGMATFSSILAWKILGGLQSVRSPKKLDVIEVTKHTRTKELCHQ